MALVHKMATCAFFCGFDVKKVTATMSSPSSMVVVWWKRRWLEVLFFLFFFFLSFLWCFWFSSLELTINNKTMVFFFVEGYNG
jgi:hypothetical protein